MDAAACDYRPRRTIGGAEAKLWARMFSCLPQRSRRCAPSERASGAGGGRGMRGLAFASSG
eukprot:365328-Chlamydomonas_euryale.AAC.4